VSKKSARRSSAQQRDGMADIVVASQAWYRALDRAQWNALIASNLGWLFDGYETYALILTVGFALRQLLDPAQFQEIPFYAGVLIAITLLGWGMGGLIGGVLADYIGRKRTMMLAILAYSLATGLSAFAWDALSFAVLRFLVGVAIGSEWVTGASIVSELWPDHARGRGVALMQCGLGLGFFLASMLWVVVGDMGPNAWRVMFLIGVLPALLTLWVRRAIPESNLWERVNDRRRAVVGRQRSGAALQEHEQALARFTLVELFHDAEIRRRTLIAFLMSLATMLGFWGITAWVPPYIAGVAAKAGLPEPQWAGFAGMAYNLGGIAGYVAFGFLADFWGRKPITMAYFAGSLVCVPVVFVWTQDLALLLLAATALGWFANGQFTWLPAWLPELFPTRIRATGAGFVFNAPRLIAWIGPLVSGSLIATFGGFSQAAMAIGTVYVLGLAAAPFLPETKGKPLPA
jgi:MFS family permease